MAQQQQPPPLLEKTFYIGPFVHCESPTELDICPNGMIGVDERGKIAFINRSHKGKRIPFEEGWEDAKVVRINGMGFFFPGFIGISSSSLFRPCVSF